MPKISIKQKLKKGVKYKVKKNPREVYKRSNTLDVGSLVVFEDITFDPKRVMDLVCFAKLGAGGLAIVEVDDACGIDWSEYFEPVNPLGRDGWEFEEGVIYEKLEVGQKYRLIRDLETEKFRPPEPKDFRLGEILHCGGREYFEDGNYYRVEFGAFWMAAGKKVFEPRVFEWKRSGAQPKWEKYFKEEEVSCLRKFGFSYPLKEPCDLSTGDFLQDTAFRVLKPISMDYPLLVEKERPKKGEILEYRLRQSYEGFRWGDLEAFRNEDGVIKHIEVSESVEPEWVENYLERVED